MSRYLCLLFLGLIALFALVNAASDDAAKKGPKVTDKVILFVLTSLKWAPFGFRVTKATY